MIRIGHGFDVHKIDNQPPMILGGVEVSNTHGLTAHSDGDVLLHAIADALLGAAGLGDIGQHFPDTDPKYKGIDSRTLLRHVVSLLGEEGLVVANLDSTIVAQMPKMAPHIEAMRSNIATDLKIDTKQVNVKATTTEQLGYIGRGEGIACHAVVIIQSRE